MEIVISGTAATIQNLKRIDGELSNLDAPMRQATLLVAGDARRNAPIDTGRLRASIVPEVTHSGNEIVGVVDSNVAYAPFMELGTRPHWPPIGALEVWARRHGTTAFLVARAIARRGLRARRYLQRALEDNVDRIIRLFTEHISKTVRK